jgi:hypothetical protein
VDWQVSMPEGRRITSFRVSPWQPPPRRERLVERGWCVNCKTECSREEGTQTWFNFYGRSECKALGLEGPHEVVPGDGSDR